MGVGGNNSWGREALDKYRLTDDSYSYTYRLPPFHREQAELARKRFDVPAVETAFMSPEDR